MPIGILSRRRLPLQCFTLELGGPLRKLFEEIRLLSPSSMYVAWLCGLPQFAVVFRVSHYFWRTPLYVRSTSYYTIP